MQGVAGARLAKMVVMVARTLRVYVCVGYGIHALSVPLPRSVAGMLAGVRYSEVPLQTGPVWCEMQSRGYRW